MSIPQLTYNTVSHYVQNPSTGLPVLETSSGIPTETWRFSDKNPYNIINVTFTPDVSLAYYEVRVTPFLDDYGVGIGSRLYYNQSNIPMGVPVSFSIALSKSYPTLANDGAFRIGFYGKAADAEGLWDATYLLISSNYYIMAPSESDYDGIELLEDRAIPES